MYKEYKLSNTIKDLPIWHKNVTTYIILYLLKFLNKINLKRHKRPNKKIYYGILHENSSLQPIQPAWIHVTVTSILHVTT
jgi:hypothetical protein